MALDEGLDPSPRSEPMNEPEARGRFRRTILGFAGAYAEVLVLSLIVNLLALAAPVFAIVVFDQLVPHYGQDLFLRLLAGVGAALGFGLLLKILRDHIAMSAGSAVAAETGDRLFRRLLTPGRAAGRDGGQTALAADVEGLGAGLGAAPVVALVDLPFVALFIAAAYAIGGQVAGIPLAAALAMLLVSLFLQVPVRSSAMRAHDFRRRRDHFGNETLNGLESVRATGSEIAMLRRWRDLAEETRLADRSVAGFALIAANVNTVAAGLAVVGVIGFGAGRVAQGDMTVGGLVAVAMLSAAAMVPLERFASSIAARQRGRAARTAIAAQIDAPVERQEEGYAGTPDFAGAIVFQDVTFRYPNRTGMTLDGVSFRIEPGEKVGLIGRMGAGKSAVMRLIMGIYEPEGGAVTIGGTNIRRIDPAQLRSAMAWAPQEARLFDGTLRENLTWGTRLRDDDEVVRAARIVGVDEFAGRHPEGFGMPVGPEGRFLSGGERQAVAVARALLRDGQVLLLDEPTSAFDNTSERRFRMRLSHVLGERTLLLATNRASMLSLVDRVIVIDGGRIVADGAREDVVDGLQGGLIQALQEAS